MNPSELRIASGLALGQRYPITAQGKVIGRGQTAEIKLPDGQASENHAMVLSKDGRDFVYDLGSETGTFINGRRVDQSELKSGDVIAIGNTQIEYVQTAGARAAVPVAPSNALVPSAGTNPNASPAALQAQMLLSQMAMMQQAQMNAMAFNQGQGQGGNDAEPDAASMKDLILKLKPIWDFYRPYLRMMIVLTMIGAGVGLSSVRWMPPNQPASFEVNLIGSMANNPVKPFERGLIEFFRSAHISFRSPALIEKTLAALGEVDITPARIQGVQRSLAMEGVAKVNNNVTYRGDYRGPTPTWSLRFLAAHVRLFLDTEIDKTLKLIRVEADFLEKQLANNEKELRRTEREVLEFKKKNIDGLPEQARQYYDLLFELQKQQSTTEVAVSRIGSLKRLGRVRLNAENPLTESRISNTRPYQSAIFDVNSRLAAARASGKGEEHPEIVALKANLDELERLAKEAETSGSGTDVERRRNPTYNAIQDNLRGLDADEETARSELGRLRRDLERVRSVVDRLPELDAQYADLQRSYDTSRGLHSSIFAQLKATRLQYDLEKASAQSRYEIISPPALEVPNPLKVGLVRTTAGTVAFGVLALGLATLLRLRQLKAERMAMARAAVAQTPSTTTLSVRSEGSNLPYRW